MAKLRVDKIAAPIVKDEFTGSVHFDGTGDYLSISKSGFTNISSTGAFAIECFVYFNDLDNYSTIFASSEDSFTTGGFKLEIYNSKLRVQGNSFEHVGGSTTLSTGRWYHFAFNRTSNGNAYSFVDGVLVNSTTDGSATFEVTWPRDVGIGGKTDNTEYFNGYISNLRFCDGHTVYTENFTVPTRELDIHLGAKGVVFPAADNRTVLLACQDAYNPTTEATGRHILTGAGSLGGVPGQNLVTNGQFGQSADNWAETVVSGSIAFARDTTVFSSGGIKVTTGGGQASVTQTVTGLVVGARYTLSADLYTPSSNPGTDVATISLVNAGYNSDNAASTTADDSIQLRTVTFTASSASQIIYLSVVRADYGTFAPSGSIGYFDNISVIVNTPISDANPGLFRKTNITSTITETTGSVFFDGTDDRLDIASSTDFRIADSNTFECWINYNSLGSNNLFLGVESSYWVGYNHTGVGGASNKFVFTIYNGSSWQAVSSSTTPVVGTWYHLAAIKDGTSLKMFINGALENTTTMSGTAAVVNDFFNIGKWNQASAGQGVNGYLSNVRVCKGHAVYKSNFAPPTTELEVHEGPDDDRTVLLACYDGENIFADKSGRHIIAAYGDRLSSPTPTATDSPIGSTTVTPGLTRNVDPTAGPTFQGGAGFVSQNWLTLPKGTTTERFPNFAGADSISARGVFTGGGSPGRVNTIDYVTISTLGDATNFGDLISPKYSDAGGASDTRGITGGGTNPGNTNLIEYITIQSTGNAKDFGDLSSSREQPGGAANYTRCIFAGGYNSGHINNIDFVTIATMGNSFHFGDLTAIKRSQGGLASPTRALFAAGLGPGVSVNIDYVSIMSTGNAVDFGDISGNGGRQGPNGCSTNTRGIWAGGYNGPTFSKVIEYVTIATLGDAISFGELTLATGFGVGASSPTRGVWAGGYNPGLTNTIEYVTMASTGDATNFGDLSQARGSGSGFSNGHGGLG